MAKEFSFLYDGDTIRMISFIEELPRVFGNGQQYNKTFLKLEIDGKLKLFSEYLMTYQQVGIGLSLNPVLKLNDKALFRLGEFSFRKDLMEYLNDCPDVVKKIDEKIYNRRDMKKVVNEYNETCAN